MSNKGQQGGRMPFSKMPFIKMPFIKMNGLGNDFVVFDARQQALDLSPAKARFIADRRRGVGCDQIITMLPSSRADVFMRIQNADGSEVGACGNATRCVAGVIMSELGRKIATIETRAGLLTAAALRGGRVSVDMGEPRLDWREIPLAHEMDTLHLEFAIPEQASGLLTDPVAVNVGNPHVIFFVADAEEVDLELIGPIIENHPLFPERVNVSMAQINSRDNIRLRVWERGAGITEACGSAACATVVAATLRGHIDREATIVMDGGTLEMAWRDDNHILMTGAYALSYTGEIEIPGELK
jgi:diaminopimelate epimerase